MSAMNRVAIKNEMIARRTTQVVVILRSQGVQRREGSFLTATPAFNLTGDSGFAGDLPRQAPNKGNSHLCRRLSCTSSRKAAVAVMSDIIRDSLDL